MTSISATERNLIRTDLVYYLFAFFLSGCLVGWIYEEIFYWITEGMLRKRGILYGPWLPIYGFGTLVIFAMKPMKKHPVLLLFLCALVSGIVDYIIGYISIQCFGLRLWDYRELFWNIDGIICLRSIIRFALMGLVFLYLLEPVAERVIQRLPAKTVRSVCRVLLVVFLADCVLSALFRTPITY